MAILVFYLFDTEDNTHFTELVGYGCAYIWHNNIGVQLIGV